jgi:hypothetical protein
VKEEPLIETRHFSLNTHFVMQREFIYLFYFDRFGKKLLLFVIFVDNQQMEIINLSLKKTFEGPHDFLYRENPQSVLLGASMILFFGYSKTVGKNFI